MNLNSQLLGPIISPIHVSINWEGSTVIDAWRKIERQGKERIITYRYVPTLSASSPTPRMECHEIVQAGSHLDLIISSTIAELFQSEANTTGLK
jgi:hypothetical protein